MCLFCNDIFIDLYRTHVNVVIYLTIFLFWGFLLHQKRIMLHVCDKCNLYIDACIMIVHI